MRILTISLAIGMLSQFNGHPVVEHILFNIEGHGEMPYALSVPSNYTSDQPSPLVLVLHPGGARGSYYGSVSMRQLFEPALRDWGAIIVAPDAPTRSWATELSDRAVMGLLGEIINQYSIDRTRILVTGFSLGGRGTWFFATRHSDFFTAAIPIAGSPGTIATAAIGDMPIHIVHSRIDDVVSFEPAAKAAEDLSRTGHLVNLSALENVGHYEMAGYLKALREAGDWVREQWDSRE